MAGLYQNFVVPDVAPKIKVWDWLAQTPDLEWRKAIEELIKLRNKDMQIASREIGVLRRTGTPFNWCEKSHFKVLTGGIPDGWTQTGSTGVYTQQTVRTGGNTVNKAIRIATGAALGGLEQSVEFFPGELHQVAFWAKANSGTGRLKITTSGAASNLSHPIELSTTNAPSFVAVPSRLIREDGWVVIPLDATGTKITIEADANSSIEFCEIQFGPGAVREPDLWIPHPADESSALPQALDTTDSPTFAGVTVTGGSGLTVSPGSGATMQIKEVTESLTIAAAPTTTAVMTCPAFSTILGISVRVTTVIPTATTFTVTNGLGSQFNVSPVSTAAGSTDQGNRGCPLFIDNAADQAVIITPDVQPAAGTGVVRLTMYYLQFTPPTS